MFIKYNIKNVKQSITKKAKNCFNSIAVDNQKRRYKRLEEMLHKDRYPNASYTYKMYINYHYYQENLN